MDTCPSHESFKEQVLAGLISVKEVVRSEMEGFRNVVQAEMEGIRTDINRRFEESADDRRNLHEKTNALSIEVTRALTKLNGAQLHVHHREDNKDTLPSVHARKEDTFSGWVVVYKWHVTLLVLLSLAAGEKVLPLLLKFFGIK